MKISLAVKVVFFVFITAYSTLNFAETLRCGNKLVKLGDTSTNVKIICGTPVDIEHVANLKERNKIVKVERYIYAQGKGKLLKILEFRNGKLVSIESGPRL